MNVCKTIFLALVFYCAANNLSAQAVIKKDTSQTYTDLNNVQINYNQNLKNYNINTPVTANLLFQGSILENNTHQDLSFLLANTLPSAVSYSDAGNGVGYTGLRIRGSDLSKFNVTLNGVPYNDPESHVVVLVNIPNIAGIATSMQVERGVGSTPNGGSTFGGSININTNDITPQFQNRVYYNYTYASFNTHKHNIGFDIPILPHLDFGVSGSLINSDGYINRASTDLQSFYSYLSYHKNNTNFILNYLHGKEKTYHAWNGLPAPLLATNRRYNSAGIEIGDNVIKTPPYENQTDNYKQNHLQFIAKFKVGNFYFKNIAFTTFGVGYYEEYKHDDLLNYGFAQQGSNLIRDLYLDNIYYGNLFSVLYKVEKFDINLGINLQRYDGKHFGNLVWADALPTINNQRYYNLKANKTEISEFLKLNYNITQNLLLFVDVQFRTVMYNAEGFQAYPTHNTNKTWHFINPKIGINHKNKYGRTYLFYGLASKEPNRADFENGISIQSAPEPETLHDVELSNEFKLNKFKWHNTLFLMLYKNQLVFTGQINDVGSLVRHNVGKSYRTGIESELEISILKNLSIVLNATYSINKNLDYEVSIKDEGTGKFIVEPPKTTDISYSPSVILGYNIKWNAYSKNTTRLQINFSGQYVGSQYLDNSSNADRQLNAYYVHNLSLNGSYNIFQLSGGINNIFNVLYEPNGFTYTSYTYGVLSSTNYYYPMSGINFFVKVAVDIKQPIQKIKNLFN